MKKCTGSYQKLFVASVASAVTIGTIAVAVPVHVKASEVKIPSFSDVKNIESHHFYESVRSLASRGIVNGFGDGTFRPHQSVTRGQLSSVLALTLGLDTKNVKNPGFTDVKVTNPYYGSIAALVEAGIIEGYNDKTFKPSEPVTRAHIAKMLSIGFNLEHTQLTTSPFTDVKAEHWYANYVQALITHQITTGTTPTTFEPNAFVTRGQMASFIVRSESSSAIVLNDAAPTIIPTDPIIKNTGQLVSVANDTVKLSTGTFTMSPDVKKVLNASNSAALSGAVLAYIAKDGVIIEISSLELTANGSETNPVSLDGQGATFTGAMRVNADYVSLKNISFVGDVEIGKEVKNSFQANEIKVLGKVSFTDNASVNQANQVSQSIATESKEPNFVFTNATIQAMELAKSKKVIIEVRGNSTVHSVNLLSNVHLKSEKGSSIPKMTVKSGVTNITLDASVGNLVIETPYALSIDGTATIHTVTIESRIDLKLRTIGKIEKIIVALKGTTLTVGTGTKVAHFELPQGVTLRDVLVNYDELYGSWTYSGGNTGTSPDTNPTPNPNPPTTGGEQPFTLSLMHFNDTHAHLDNAAKRVTAVKEVRVKNPKALLLDAGDVFSGTLYFNEFQGQADLEFMNLMKVDAMTFGNHEFDLGSSAEGHKALVEFIKAAKFPFVSSNVDFSKDHLFDGLFNTKISSTSNGGNIYTGIVKDIDGQKVGIFGLTTADTKDISSPGSITFSNYIEDAKKMVAEFEKMGINKIVAITHIGYDDNPAVDNDIELAKAVKGIDIIVGGHSHTALAEPVVSKANNAPTIIVQAGQYADNLGTLDVTFDKNGIVTAHEGKLIKIADKIEDVEAAKILEKYASKIKEIKNKPTGATAVHALENPRLGNGNTTSSVRRNETPLGNLISDGMLEKAKEYDRTVVMAFQNGGGIREAIDQGPITVGEVIAVLPFGNTLATMELTGAEIKQTFETSFKEYPKENGGFLHVSGAKVQFDSAKPAGQRVVSIAYENADGTYTTIQDTEKYTIATNAFTAKGGDGYEVLKKAYEEGRVTDLGLSDWENLRDHIVNLRTVDPEIEGRIVDVAGQEPDTEIPGGPIEEKDFSGTVNTPKVYKGDVTVAVTDIASFANVIVKGNLILTGTPTADISFLNIKVERNLDLSGLNGDILNFDGIDVGGETIL